MRRLFLTVHYVGAQGIGFGVAIDLINLIFQVSIPCYLLNVRLRRPLYDMEPWVSVTTYESARMVVEHNRRLMEQLRGPFTESDYQRAALIAAGRNE